MRSAQKSADRLVYHLQANAHRPWPKKTKGPWWSTPGAFLQVPDYLIPYQLLILHEVDDDQVAVAVVVCVDDNQI
jgi:hypothetical protein